MNTTTQKSVGKDILSHCSKCKLNLSHTIVSMLNEKTVAKVKCNTCQSVHKFKDPATIKIAKKKSSSSPKKPSLAVAQETWEEAIKKHQGASKPYSIKEKFFYGDVIDHPQFGKGVVGGLLEHDKIKVIFKTDEKTLLHNKK